MSEFNIPKDIELQTLWTIIQIAVGPIVVAALMMNSAKDVRKAVIVIAEFSRSYSSERVI